MGCECGHEEDHRLTFSAYDRVSSGEDVVACPECGKPLVIGLSPDSTMQVILKDGPSGGWASRAIKENKYRARRRVEMGRRERDHVKKTTLLPNYGGVETGTWREAQEAARSDRGELSATTYNPLVEVDKA